MMDKERIDKLLMQRKLVKSRDRARALIMAGQVLVNDQTIEKAGTQVDKSANIRLKVGDIPYVSRGGVKLAQAIKTFQVNVTGRVAIDVGASTGGFTDCLLQCGTRKVFAVDVGYGQLAWKLRKDIRVINMERTNIKNLTKDQFDEPPDLAVIDASFISLGKVLPATIKLLQPHSDILALIKPQFEVGKGQVGKGGVVRDPEQHSLVIDKVKKTASMLGCQIIADCESPIRGPKGNREFFIHLRTGVAE